jgi:hypothetical protein
MKRARVASRLPPLECSKTQGTGPRKLLKHALVLVVREQDGLQKARYACAGCESDVH